MTFPVVLVIVLVMLLWAICFPLITVGIPFAPHLTFAAMRALLAGASLVAIALMLGRPMPNGGRIWAILFAVGLGATTLGFLGMFHAAEFVSPGIATVIANTQPMLAAVLASVFLREQLKKTGLLGLVLGFAGIVLIAVPNLLNAETETFAIGVAFILLAALGITASNVLIKKISEEVDALMAMGMQMLIGGFPLSVAAMMFEQPLEVVWSNHFLIALLSLSIPGTAVAYGLWFWILKKVPLNQANAFSFLVPILGLSMGVLFFEESFGPYEIGGIVLALFGIFLVSRSDSRQMTRLKAESAEDGFRSRG